MSISRGPESSSVELEDGDPVFATTQLQRWFVAMDIPEAGAH
jgi:hypothetical protein